MNNTTESVWIGSWTNADFAIPADFNFVKMYANELALVNIQSKCEAEADRFLGVACGGNSLPVAVNDTVSMSEGAGTVVVNALTNDTDANGGDTKTIIEKTDGTNGTVTITGGGTTLTYDPGNTFHGTDTFTYVMSDNKGGTATATVTVNVLNSFTWTGASSPTTTNWTDPENWYNGLAAPDSTQIAIFDGTCSSNCSPTIDANITIKGIEMNTGYTGTITQGAGRTIVVENTGWTQSAGTFTGGNSSIDIAGKLEVAGGTFTSTSGNLILVKDTACCTGGVSETALKRHHHI
jgi:hypothetical protein